MRVLHVEDHPINRLVIRAMLSAHGAEIVEAKDGAEGILAVETGEFDIVLMDLRMPGIDGLGALRAIRARKDAKAHVPIIIVTADALPVVKAECLAAGASEVIHKPVGVKALYATIGSVLAVRSAAA